MPSMSIVRIMVVALAAMAAAVPQPADCPSDSNLNGLEFANSQPEYH
jgi:hypothetical protein